MTTIPTLWKATATAAGRETVTVEFQHEGSKTALHAEAERLLLSKLKPSLLSTAPRGSHTPIVVDTLQGHGYRIASIETLDEDHHSPSTGGKPTL